MIRLMVGGDQMHHPGYKEFEVELRAQISDLPTDDTIVWGSKAFCTQDSSLWTLGSDKVWKELV